MTRGSLLFAFAYASPAMVHLSLFVGSSVRLLLCVFDRTLRGWWGWCIILWKDVLLVLIRRRNDTKRTFTSTCTASFTFKRAKSKASQTNKQTIMRIGRFSICLLVNQIAWFLPLWKALFFLYTYSILSTSKYPFWRCYGPKIVNSLRKKWGYIMSYTANRAKNLTPTLISRPNTIWPPLESYSKDESIGTIINN